MRRIDLVVGPSGAGKSTFVEQRLAPLPTNNVVVNADVIAKDRWPAADVTSIVAGFVDRDAVGEGTPANPWLR